MYSTDNTSYDKPRNGTVLPFRHFAILSVLTLCFLFVWRLPSIPGLIPDVVMPLWLHTLAEFFSILISIMCFGMAWHTYSRERPGNISILAIGVLAVGLVDIGHVMSFRGMPDLITPSGIEKAINFWLVARFITAVLLLFTAYRGWLPFSKPNIRYWLLVVSLIIVAMTWWMAILHQNIWPHTFIQGVGLTPFKKSAELFISTLLAIAAFGLYRNLKQRWSYTILLIFCATYVTILSEFCFTIYSDVTDIFNLVGHVYKVIAYIFIYYAIFVESVREPFIRLKNVQESLNFQRVLLQAQAESTQDGVLTVDKDRNILWCNKRFVDLWGMPREYIDQRDDVAMLNDALDKVVDPNGFLARIEYLNSHQTESSLDVIHLLNGKSYERYTAPVLGDGDEVLGRIWVFHDVTVSLKAEQELLSYQDKLESLVAIRTLELTNARDAAQAASKAKGTFLSNMSHELRTPLNSILGYSGLQRNNQRIPPEFRKQSEVVYQSAHHLLGLINTILDLSKIEAGVTTLSPEPCNIDMLLSEVSDMLHIKALEKGLVLRVQKAGLASNVLVDGGKLKQILINLAGNAIKFTKNGEVRMEVRLVYLEQTQVKLQFTVCDTGPGIPSSAIDHLYDPFFQIDTGSPIEGTGLGLPISKKFIELMGGELKLVSHLGRGTQFDFSLELPYLPEVRSVSLAYHWDDLVGRGKGKTIVVADDTPEALELLVSMLQPLGAEIVMAGNGREAQKHIIDKMADIAFLDWRMPEADGIEVVKFVRDSLYIKQPKLIMVTAYAFQDRENVALDAGADDFMTKPVLESRLLEVLAKYLGTTPREESDLIVNVGETNSFSDVFKRESQDLRDKLTLAARELDEHAIKRILVELRDQSLAEYLNDLVDTMQYSRLWQVLEVK